MSFFERVKQHAAKTPERIAVSRRLVGGAYELTSWSDLAALSERFAAYLSLSDAHYVPIFCIKSAETIAAMVGALAAAKAFVSLNPKLRLPQVINAIVATGARHCVIDVDSLRVVAEGAEDRTLAEVEWIIIGDPAKAERNLTRFRAAGVRFKLFREISADGPFAQREFAVGTAACCLFTSGSTGTPKGVLISHDDLIGRAEAEREWFALDPSDVALSLLPFSFDVGLTQLLGALWVGCELVIIPSWLPADIMAAVRERKVTGICAVPSIWQDFLKSSVVEYEGIESLRYVTVSGGSLPDVQLESLSRLFPGVGIFKTYGQTEAFRTTSLPPSDLFRKQGSVGKAYIGVQVSVVDPDGNRCAPGVVGEVVHSGLGTMLGYLGGNGNGEKLRRLPGSDALSVFTGDMGYLDDEGFLYLRGRRDSMVKVAGNRVFPAEIANQIAAFPEVAEVQVVIVPDERGDATIHAFLIERAGHSIDIAALRAKLRNLLPTYMQPQRLTVLRTMPRTATGKPDLVALASLASGSSIATPT